MIRKTAAITAASLAGVVLAGGAAIGANVGILTAAGNSSLGQLSAEAPAQTQAVSADTAINGAEQFTISAEDLPVQYSAPAPDGVSATAQTEQADLQAFAVDVAGTVEVTVQNGALYVSDVQANPGWNWESGRDTPQSVKVTFTTGADTFEFYADLNPDGTVNARVDQPIVIAAPPAPAVASPAPPSGGSRGDDDSYEDHEDEDHEDEDHEDEDHEDEDHEGKDDDD